MATGLSPEELKKKVEEAVKSGGKAAAQEIAKDADPQEAYCIIIPTVANTDPTVQQKLKGVNGIVKMVVENESYWIKITDGVVEGGKGEPPSAPNATITQSLDTFKKVQSRQLDPQMAFMQGLLKISGDMGLIMRLAQLLR